MSFLRNIGNFLNPAYHLRRLREDLTLMRKAIALRKTLSFEDHDITPEELFRGKLFTTFFLSGPSAITALPLGYWIQRLTSNLYVGFFITVFFAALISSAAYQLVWWIDNKRLYRVDHHDPWSKFLEIQRDLMPVHATAMRVGISLGAVSTFWLGGLVLAPIQLFFPQLVAVVPAGLLLFILDAILVQAPFMRIMGDFFEKHGRTLAQKYRPALGFPIVD